MDYLNNVKARAEMTALANIGEAVGLKDAAAFLRHHLLLARPPAPAEAPKESPQQAGPVDPPQCGEQRGNQICVGIKGHRSRHTWRNKPHVPPPSRWVSVQEISYNQVDFAVGQEVVLIKGGKVTQKNPEGADQPGWKITKIERSREDSADINVEIHNAKMRVARPLRVVKIVKIKPASKSRGRR